MLIECSYCTDLQRKLKSFMQTYYVCRSFSVGLPRKPKLSVGLFHIVIYILYIIIFFQFLNKHHHFSNLFVR
jgi:hypothetical protein